MVCSDKQSHETTAVPLKLLFPFFLRTANIFGFIHSFILNIYIAPLQENYSEALSKIAKFMIIMATVTNHLSISIDFKRYPPYQHRNRNATQKLHTQPHTT